ncbi:hypothetical protein ACYT84_09230 [Ralstonia solanacearum]|uniref:hypothetical protein n=1 Tax=Ralstonia solanacearum TaxID=305 RepID=UPI0018D08608|nr:hypothetical protein [Ralstonia solanacearum]
MKLLSLFKRLTRKQRSEAPAAAPAPTSTLAPTQRPRRRKKRNSKRNTPPGARRINANAHWLDQAQGKQ